MFFSHRRPLLAKPPRYEAVVDFCDPITRYSTLSGYLFNIAFLRRAFDPSFTLHDMRPSVDEPYGITTRWTMSMRFTAAAALPTRKYWNPTITFTGGWGPRESQGVGGGLKK